MTTTALRVVLNWSTCIPSIPRDGEFKDDQLKRWKTLTASGQLIFKQSGGQPTPYRYRCAACAGA